MDLKEYIFQESLDTYYLDEDVLIYEENGDIVSVLKSGKIFRKHLSQFAGGVLDTSIFVLPISFFEGGFFIPYIQPCIQEDVLRVLEYSKKRFKVITLLGILDEFGSRFESDCNINISDGKESIFSFELESGNCKNGAVYKKEDGSYDIWYD